MIPRPFAMDAQNRAQDLASTILSASTPPQISSACAAVDSFLHRHASDQSRAFFSIAFPALVCRLFGFDSPSPHPSSSSSSSSSSPLSSAWIDHAASDLSLASLLFSLLAPDGALFSSISAVDRHALVHYVFPVERLPEWMRLALQNDRSVPALADLCPLFKSRVKYDKIQSSYQLHLNVFEYYVFWFAYYPVCRGNSESPDPGTVRKTRRFRLENWTSSLPVLTTVARRSGPKTECSLYLRLLYSYLCAFVPKCGLGSHQPYRSSLLHYSSSHDSSVFTQAEFLVYALIHFWMIDNDFSPLPVSLCRSFGITFPFRAILGETPPTAGLGDPLKLLVKYLNCSLIPPTEGNEGKMFEGSSVRKVSGLEKSRAAMGSFENSLGAWNSVMQRPLYRFILRTFLFCPTGASIKNAAQVFSLWVDYMMPWKITAEDFAEFDSSGTHNLEGSRKEKSLEGKEGSRMESVYVPVWQGYVLSNYLFYSSLVVHFLGFAHKFLHANVESTIQMVSKLLDILTSSKELMELLQKVDAAYHSKPSGPTSSYYDGVYKYVPSIREQLLDWEDGLCESDADGSFLHENWNNDLKLFSDAEEGAQKLLQLFILRAEHEIQTISGDVSQNFQSLDSIKSHMNAMFGGHVRDSHLSNSPEKAHVLHPGQVEVFTPNHPGFGKRKWSDIKYKGDWMRRPISDTEVAWLARLLISLSDWLNEVLGLDRVDICDYAGPTVVDVAHEAEYMGGTKEFIFMVGGLLGSWLGLFSHSVLRFMRRHGMRINLRVLASKKFVMVLVLYVAFVALKKAFNAVLLISAPM